MRRAEKRAIRRQAIDLVLRYALLAAAGFFLASLYNILLPVTIYPLYWLFKISHQASVAGSILSVNEVDFDIASSCVAVSAYFLLLILNLSTKGIKIGKRMAILAVDFALLLAFNIARIFLLIILYLSNFRWFDITHQIFWYAVSILIVVLIWIFTARWFGIEEKPFISDFNFIRRIIRFRRF